MSDMTAARKVLVLIHGAQHSMAAVQWAAEWCAATGDNLTFLHVIEPDGMMNIGMIQDVVRAEQWQAAENLLLCFTPLAETTTGKAPAHIIREGSLKEAVRSVIKEEEGRLSLLVLSATHREGGPAPLIAYLSSRMGSRVQVPMVLVPSAVNDDKIV